MLMRIFARTRVTKLTLPSPSIVITENQVLGNSWIHSERAGLGASSRSAGVRFTAAVERSWGARRPVNVHHPLQARLVTISACYGSGLRSYVGEGLVGLACAFLRAGAHGVIAALWQADDAATPLLMDRLYGELEAGRTPDEALRTAKLSLIHSTSVYRKPFYWGAFQLYAGS